jgi:hypothetical protein
MKLVVGSGVQQRRDFIYGVKPYPRRSLHHDPGSLPNLCSCDVLQERGRHNSEQFDHNRSHHEKNQIDLQRAAHTGLQNSIAQSGSLTWRERQKYVGQSDRTAGTSDLRSRLVHDYGADDARGRPGRQQPAMDGADELRAEHVRKIGRHCGKAAAIHGQDDAEGEHEPNL